MFKGRTSQGASPTTSPRQYQLRPVQLKRMLRWAFFAACLTTFSIWLFFIIGGKLQERKFFADVQHRQAMGDKVLINDFISIAPRDDQNAATYILKAIDQLQLNPHQGWLIDDAENYRLSEEAKFFVAQYSREHPQIRALLQQAGSCPQVDWHVKWRSPALDVHMPYLSRQREFGRFLEAVGICEHEVGDDAAALRTAQEIFFLARAVDNGSTVVGHLVALELEHMGDNLCLRLTGPLTSRAARHIGNFNAIAKPMIASLCDDPRFRSQFDAAIRGDRMVIVDSIIHLPISKFEAFSSTDALLEDYDQSISAAAHLSWPAAAPLLPSKPRKSEPDLAQALAPVLYRPFISEFSAEAERHAAAIAIACRLYVDDHDGEWPLDLSTLVPHYLPAIPCDPFDSQLRPMKYLPGNPPAIYSVSTNGIDNHGDRAGALSYKYGFYYDPWRSPDAVFPIGGVIGAADKRPPEHGEQ